MAVEKMENCILSLLVTKTHSLAGIHGIAHNLTFKTCIHKQTEKKTAYIVLALMQFPASSVNFYWIPICIWALWSTYLAHDSNILNWFAVGNRAIWAVSAQIHAHTQIHLQYTRKSMNLNQSNEYFTLTLSISRRLKLVTQRSVH